jgi:hypothetical protein
MRREARRVISTTKKDELVGKPEEFERIREEVFRES